MKNQNLGHNRRQSYLNILNISIDIQILGIVPLLDEIHGLADSLLHSPLDLLLFLLREVSFGIAARRAVVGHGQLVVVLAGSVSHQVGVVGRGWVGHGPNNIHMIK